MTISNSFQLLCGNHTSVYTSFCHELVMPTLLYYPSCIKDNDIVSILHACKSMGNHDRGTTLRCSGNRFSNLSLGVCVKLRRCFVKKKNLWVSQESTRNSQSLSLTTRKL